MSNKTNVIRILDKAKIEYKSYSYADTDAVSGEEVAKTLGLNPRQMFKTLVTLGKSGTNYVFLVPVSDELNLRKAAMSVNEKSIHMIKQKDLLALTGYVHGGCSPIGMKKEFEVTIDNSAIEFETIIFNAGKIGYQVQLSLECLKKVLRFRLDNII